MELHHYFPSLTFAVPTADQFVGRDGGPLQQQKQDCYAGLKKKTHISDSDFKENQSPHFKDDEV